jgi:hypothetical protein
MRALDRSLQSFGAEISQGPPNDAHDAAIKGHCFGGGRRVIGWTPLFEPEALTFQGPGEKDATKDAGIGGGSPSSIEYEEVRKTSI